MRINTYGWLMKGIQTIANGATCGLGRPHNSARGAEEPMCTLQAAH